MKGQIGGTRRRYSFEYGLGQSNLTAIESRRQNGLRITGVIGFKMASSFQAKDCHPTLSVIELYSVRAIQGSNPNVTAMIFPRKISVTLRPAVFRQMSLATDC